MRLKTWHCLSLLALAVLLTYYPALHAGYNSVDDLKMISSIEASGPLDPVRLFVRSGSYYYRPLTILTYTLDRDAWGSVASFMHLENILLHLLCALLVYAITRRILPLWGSRDQWPALFAGLFFALHPLTTESVSWISGRTDPLMAVFLLLGVWLTVVGLATKRPVTFLGAGIALFLAPLAKEVAVFVLPGLLWLIAAYPGEGRLFERLRSRWCPLLATTTGVAGYFVLRTMASGHDSGIKTALKGVTAGDGGGAVEVLDKARIAFKVYGFYFKKLFVPWPLNFGIVEISGWYVLAGITLALVLLYLLRRADVAGAFGLMAFCALSPALLVVFGKMTWTPLAERYLYSSIALFAPLAAIVTFQWRLRLAPYPRRRCDYALVALFFLFFATTLHRAWIWQDNLRLYSDTVAKNSDFAAAKTELASALMLRGRTAEAQDILAEMQSGSTAPDYINDDMRLAVALASKGDLEGARRILTPLLDKNPKKRFEVLQLLIRTNDQRLGKTADPTEKAGIQRENLDLLMEEQRIRPAAFTLYRIGKQYLAMGNKDQALEYFKKAYAQAPKDAHYHGAVATFIRRLEGS